MINIYIETEKMHASTAVEMVPRIGELIEMRGIDFRVTDVKHVIGDRYTDSSIKVLATEEIGDKW